MSKEWIQFSKHTTLLITAAAFLATLMGFAWLLLSLHHEGLKTRAERLYYLPYQLVQAEQAKLDEARMPIKLQSREIEPGVYEHTLEIQSSAGERVAQMSELGLELSAPSEWKLISADVTFQGNEGTKKSANFATSEQKKQGTNSSVLLKAMPKAQDANPGSERGLLTIKSTGSSEISVCVQKSNGKPVSEILWTSVPNAEGDPAYGSLSGWFRYSEEGVPSYSKAQLLAHTWGLGVAGNRVIYTLVGIAFLLWVSGISLLLVHDLMAVKVIPRVLGGAVGCTLIFGSICLIFSFIFPPFHGPDETNHFFTYTKIAGKESLEKGALELANKGCFQRIHRRADNKFVLRDALEIRNEEWPHYGSHHYPLDRSPLERVCWKTLGKIMSHENADSVMLQLRVFNGLFVALCLLLALAVAGSIFPMRHLAPWFSAPVLLIPCIAHYSTVVSNYPFLIGGYVIQVVVLGILWASLDSSQISNRNLAKNGALLGLGLGIALCSADNAMVTLPFWGVILPAWLMARRLSEALQTTGMKDAVVLLGSMIGTLIIFCIALATVSINHSFLPGMTSTKLAQILPVHGSQFVAGIGLIVIYSAALVAFTWLLSVAGPKIYKISWRIPWRTAGFVGLALITIALMLWKAPPVPEIDLSRGANTTAIKYAVTVVGAFADGLFPGQADGMICGSFWRKLGWLETDLPAGLMEFLRVSTGLGVILLMWASLRKSSVNGMGFFAMANILALVGCLMAIGVLYYTVLYNVNSRYILIAYLFAAILAAEGYRRILSGSNASKSRLSIAASCICILAMGIQSWSWVTVLNRYF
jgi:hypothetical protein